MSRRAALQQSLPSLARVLRRFAPEVRRQRVLIAGAVLATFAEIGLRLLEPWPLKFVIDRVVPGPGAGGAGMLDRLEPASLLLLCVAAVIVMAALRAAASYASTVGFALAGNRILTECRRQVFAHMLRLSVLFHVRGKRGDLVNRLTGDVARLQDIAVTAAVPFAVHLLTLAGMLGVMLWMNLWLGLIALAVVPLFALASIRIGKRLQHVARAQRQREGDMASTAAESINAIRTIHAYGLHALRDAAFASQNTATLREGVKGARLAARLERSTDLLIAFGTAGVLWLGASLAMRGELTIGDLVVFLAYLKNAFKPMRDAAKFTGRLAKAAASGERVLDLLDTPPDIRDRPGARSAPDTVHEFAFEDVSFAYGPGVAAVEGVSFRAARGQRVAIVGPSGAGKSTVLGLAARLFDATAGRVILNGIDVRDLTIDSLRARLAVVLQESVLFAATVRENIAYGRPGGEATDAEIERAAALAGADEFVRRLPAGYGTMLGERGETLSGGQRQRIALARAALRDAPVLVLDEPTTGLDGRHRGHVLETIDRLGRDRITLLITHDLAAAESADLVLYLERGRVVERGTHAELLALGGRYAAAHTLQSGERAHAVAR